jgi:hypothetical protein
MKRRKFLSASAIAVSAASVGFALPDQKYDVSKKAFYEWREYELRFRSNPADLDSYFQKALIPALNRLGVKNVGVFREIGKSEPAKIYLLIPYPAFNDYATINSNLMSDTEFIKASADYTAVPPEKSIFIRYSTSFFLAFDKLPNIVVPPSEARIFEWRNYEGHNEDAVSRKVGMFNKEEITIFYKSKLKPVYFGQMVSGSNMPSIAYMVVFKDMAERDAVWATFGADPDWKRISQAPEYANTVSKIIRIFLEPLPYSQI